MVGLSCGLTVAGVGGVMIAPVDLAGGGLSGDSAMRAKISSKWRSWSSLCPRLVLLGRKLQRRRRVEEAIYLLLLRLVLVMTADLVGGRGDQVEEE